MSAPWGASPQEWAHWADALGLAEDLLPVVSNPAAQISTISKLHGLGKVPSRYHADGTVVGIPGWTKQRSTGRQVAGWAAQPDYGICLQTRVVRAIDIDIGDPAAAAAVLDLAEMVLGPLPRRMRANSGKCLLVLRMPGEFAKRVIRTAHGAVEFLAEGQQCVVAGTHTSGARYEWAGGLPAEIPDITPAEFEAFWSALAAEHGVDSVTQRAGRVPALVRSMGDVSDSLVDWLGEAGWVREYDRDGRVHIRCPWEAGHSMDSGPSATTYFPAGVGGFAQGHFRCLHAHCTGRSDREFLDAMGLNVAAEFEPVVEPPAPVIKPGVAAEVFPAPGALPPLLRGRQGILATAQNARALAARPDLLQAYLGYDTFRDAIMISRPGDKWRPLRDTDYFELRCDFERLSVSKPPKELVRDAVLWAAWEHRFDSAQIWARQLQWDGTPRVREFLCRYMGVACTPYAEAVSEYLWSALAGRCLSPGCQVDMVPVFVSPQGTGKTSLVEALAPSREMFVELNLEHRDDNLARSLRGKLVAEIAELRGLAGREAESIRAWITRKHEEWIPKYVEYATVYPRRFLPIGTVNGDEFLADDEGERRWLPVRVGLTDKEAIRRDVGQLWAESVQMFDANGVRWRDAEALARDVHPEFKVREPWTTLISAWLEQDAMDGEEGLARKFFPVRIFDVLTSAVGVRVQDITVTHERRAGRALRELGYVKKAVRVGDGWGKFWLSPAVAEQRGVV